MSDSITIEIPVKSHLKKFVLSKYKQEPLVVGRGRKNWIPQFIYSTLTHSSRSVCVDKSEEYNEVIQVEIPPHYFSQYRFFPTDRSYYKINNFLQGCFDDYFFQFMDARCERRGDIKKNVYLWIEKNNLEEEDNLYETLKKKYYRYRESRNSDN